MKRKSEGCVKAAKPPEGKVGKMQSSGRSTNPTYTTPESKMPDRMHGRMGDARTRAAAHSKANPRMPK